MSGTQSQRHQQEHQRPAVEQGIHLPRAASERIGELVQNAQAMGANAILAMRYDANEIAAAVTEVLAYGTAVVVEPIR